MTLLLNTFFLSNFSCFSCMQSIVSGNQSIDIVQLSTFFLVYSHMQLIDAGCQSIDISQESKNSQLSHMNFIFIIPYPSYIIPTFIITIKYTITWIEHHTTISSQLNMLQCIYQVMDHRNWTHNLFITFIKLIFMFKAPNIQEWQRITYS